MIRKSLSSPGFELKAASDGTFEGYGSIFGEVDSYNEATDLGSFATSIRSIKASGRPLTLLWQHDQTKPIGTFTQLAEDSKGLHVKGQLLMEVQQAREAHALIQAQAVSGLSIGYNVRGDRIDKATGVRHLTQVDLKEISAVTFPAVENARITSIKSYAPDEIYNALREGTLPRLSISEAKKFMAAWRRLSETADPDEPNTEQLAKLAAQLNSFSKFLTTGK